MEFLDVGNLRVFLLLLLLEIVGVSDSLDSLLVML